MLRMFRRSLIGVGAAALLVVVGAADDSAMAASAGNQCKERDVGKQVGTLTWLDSDGDGIGSEKR